MSARVSRRQPLQLDYWHPVPRLEVRNSSPICQWKRSLFVLHGWTTVPPDVRGKCDCFLLIFHRNPRTEVSVTVSRLPLITLMVFWTGISISLSPQKNNTPKYYEIIMLWNDYLCAYGCTDEHRKNPKTFPLSWFNWQEERKKERKLSLICLLICSLLVYKNTFSLKKINNNMLH